MYKTQPTITGGCQCGAVRYALFETPESTVCHCRMCQKAVGGPFAALSKLKVANLTWTRGQPASFQSSSAAERHFCAACGTPLTFEWGKAPPELSIGAFDDPGRIRPVIQMDMAARMPWFAELASLPERPDAEAPWLAEVVSYQHPDHDTDTWPPTDGAAG